MIPSLAVVINGPHTTPEGDPYSRAVFQLLKCGGCGRGGLATVYCGNEVHNGQLVDFYPFSPATAELPESTPDEIVAEFREAELCAAVEANRSASAMFRSALEKTLKANGYRTGNLKSRIDHAAADGLITASRRTRVHEDIRTLGNDVLHDEWHPVDDSAVALARRFTQRTIEDFYDDRPTAEKILREKGRLPAGSGKAP